MLCPRLNFENEEQLREDPREFVQNQMRQQHEKMNDVQR